MTPALQDDPVEDIAQAIEDGWLPIREVARQTGVNAVTLRAWERRYGLIVPQRTPKGHRLFSAEHVQRIHTILTWLNRGVPVSQVKGLIDSAQASPDSVENEWHVLRHKLLTAISELAERRVDDLFNQAMALYPPRTLCEQLMLPLLNALEQRWQGQFGAQMERVFFCPGCAASSARAFTTTTASSRARRCCWSTSQTCPWSHTCGLAPGWPAAPTAPWRFLIGLCRPANWPWPWNTCNRVRCCCTQAKPSTCRHSANCWAASVAQF